MRIVYRNRTENGVLAGVTASVAVPLAIRLSLNETVPRLARAWIALWFVAWSTIFFFRSLRRSITIDEAGVTKRGVVLSWFTPWASVRALECLNDDRCLLVRSGDQGEVDISGRAPPRHPPLAEACRQLWTAHAEHPAPAEAYPRRGNVRLALLASAVGLLVGLPLWLVAARDGDRYVARAARERSGAAVVSRVWVESDDNGEGDTEYTTFVAARLQLDGRRPVAIELHRPEDVASRYAEEASLPVVYDPARPRDADFVDRPTRTAQDADVRARGTWGPILLFAGLVGVMGSVALARFDWRRRLP
jgi:hypothetical protein